MYYLLWTLSFWWKCYLDIHKLLCNWENENDDKLEIDIFSIDNQNFTFYSSTKKNIWMEIFCIKNLIIWLWSLRIFQIVPVKIHNVVRNRSWIHNVKLEISLNTSVGRFKLRIISSSFFTTKRDFSFSMSLREVTT